VVRSLAGMIGAVGMMQKDEMARFAEVWNWYCLGKDNHQLADLEKLSPKRHRNVDIECIGVWDTVGALGIPGSRFCARAFGFHDTALGVHVRHAFQALAIDERRGNFQAAVWVPFDQTRRRRGAAEAATQPEAKPEPEPKPEPKPEDKRPRQVLKQMWFPGVHSNVGGGYPQHGMSDSTFLWMRAQLQGLLGFDCNNIVSSLDNVASEFYPGGKLEDSRTLAWKLIACPVPRPIGIISETERVHESAWGRSAKPPLVPADDVYQGESRQGWLEVIGLQQVRDDIEKKIAELPRPPDPPPVNIPRKLGVCGRILELINPQG
jgi:T6SS, Phospholipase effector Tle1-like, catalytic domain